MFAN
jgi:hypothetical protein